MTDDTPDTVDAEQMERAIAALGKRIALAETIVRHVLAHFEIYQQGKKP